ncbi:MAG: hypothetical protein O6761_08870 [Thaumarchaeota archaeon]|nr:hypothetical protein [Nitrososphaerota archaeon]
MGLSIVVAGGIVMIAMMSMLFVIPSVIESIVEIDDVASQVLMLNDDISKTSIDIQSLVVLDDIVKFGLFDDDIEKLWNYDDFTLIVTYDADISGTKTKITEEFTYNSTASFQGIAQFVRPDGELVQDWDQETNCPAEPSHYLCINEVTRDDTDYVTSKKVKDDQTREVEFSLSDPNPTPGVGSKIIVSYTFREEDQGDDPDLVITLRQGTTSIATWTETNQLPLTFALASRLLSAAQVSSISDYDDLRLEFVADCNSAGCGGGNERVSVSWAEVAILPYMLANQWIIDNITSDIMDPRILNHDENAQILAKLSYSVFSGGDVIVAISTDKGVLSTSAIIAP